MGAAAPKQQLNTDNRSPKAAPRPIKDTTRTRYNAIRHGILARSVVLPGEDPQQYQDVRTALSRDLDIVGMLEEMWLDQLVSCYWRQQRILRAEAETDAKLEVLHRYEVGLLNEMKSLLAEIREAQRIRRNGYANSKISPDHCREFAAAAARHERGFWEAVQDELDGPKPTPEPSRGAGEETRNVSVSPASPRGAAVSAAMPPPAPSPPPTIAAPEPVAAPPPELAPDVPVSDAAVRFAIESRSEYTPVERVNPPKVRAFVGDHLGVMSRNEDL